MTASCTQQVDYCITRGTTFETMVALTTAFVEVIEDLSAYEGVLVFRDGHYDGAQEYLTLTANVEAIPPDTPAAISFVATPAQTETLPAYDIVAYCDLRTRNGQFVQRLFTADVEIEE